MNDRYRLSLAICPNGHKFTVTYFQGETAKMPLAAIMVDDSDGGGTRITSAKCCGQWRTEYSFALSAAEWRALAELAEQAAESIDGK